MDSDDASSEFLIEDVKSKDTSVPGINQNAVNTSV